MFNIKNIDRKVEMFVFDIFVAILKIKDTANRFKNVQDLLHSYNQWDSIIREFEIIGEASKYLLKDEIISKKYRQIVDFRNKISHEYFGIDPDEVWGIIFNHLDDYELIIVNIIKDIEPTLKQELIDSFIEDNYYLDFVVKALK